MLASVVPSPTFEPSSSATVDPPIVLSARAPPPLTATPLPCDETWAPTEAAKVCAAMSAVRVAETETAPVLARLATCVMRAVTSLPISLLAREAPMATLGLVPVSLAFALRFAETARAMEVALMRLVSLAETLMPPAPAVTASSVPPLPSMTAVVVVTILLPT
ncbi:hypothetical protein HPGCJGGD_3729 [Methylobacterium haplocladii]|nr:hypothetical protein HPGCJGGD_3729 [Methylobacterium haplocladii]